MRNVLPAAAVLGVSATVAAAQTPPGPPRVLPPSTFAVPMIPGRVPDVGGSVPFGRAPVVSSRAAGPEVPVPTVGPEVPAPVGGPAGGEALPRRAVRDLGRGVRDLAADGWRVVTVPTRMDSGDLAVLGGVLGVGGLLYVWDEGLYEAVRRQEGHGLHDGLREVGDFAEPVGLMGNTNRWYGLGVVVGYVAGWEPLLWVSRDLLTSHWLAAATYNPPRRRIGRKRPEDGEGPRAYGDGTSLPSGHASTIVQVAAVLSHHVEWTPARVVFWGLAGTVLFQRVDSGKHWPSDVWIGAAWGYGVARLVLARADVRRDGEPTSTEGPASTERGPGPWLSRESGAGGLQVAPYVDPGSGRPGVAVRVPVGWP